MKVGKSTRMVMHDALKSHLQPVVDGVRKMGLLGEVHPNKRIRTALHSSIIQSCKWGAERTGLPEIAILRLCLGSHVIARRRKQTGPAQNRPQPWGTGAGNDLRNPGQRR
jgi:hypothetical protein